MTMKKTRSVAMRFVRLGASGAEKGNGRQDRVSTSIRTGLPVSRPQGHWFHASSKSTLLGAPGLTIRSKGLTTSNKN